MLKVRSDHLGPHRVALRKGQQQETLGGRSEPPMSFTEPIWLTIGSEQVPRALTAAEKGGLRALAVLIRERLRH